LPKLADESSNRVVNLRKRFWSHPGNGSHEQSESFRRAKSFFIRGKRQKERSCMPRFEQRLTTLEWVCTQASRLPARLSTDPASSHQGTQEGETLPGTARISWSETRCDPESFSLARRIAIHCGKLPFFLWLALSNANRAGRKAFSTA
jgi:hypothetical protein